MRKALLSPVLSLLVALTAAPAPAAECAWRDLIVGTADAILDGRPGLGKFAQRRFGAGSVYLKLHYQPLSPDAAIEAARALDAAGVREARELLAVLVLARDGVAAGLAVYDPDPGTALAASGDSFRRALVRRDAAAFFDTVALLPPGPAGDPLRGQLGFGGSRLHLWVADRDDAARQALAGLAEARGYPLAALALLADMADRGPYDALAARLAGDPKLGQMIGTPAMQNALAGLWQFSDPPLPFTRPDGADMHRLMGRVLAAALREEGSSLLGIFANQSGRIAEAAAAGDAYRAAIAAGTLDPVREPEAAWLYLARSIRFEMGGEAAGIWLTGFDWPVPRVRHYAGRVDASLDLLVAREALGPVVAGAPLPGRPAELGQEFDWAAWSAAAEALARGEAPADPAMAAELLTAAGRWPEALEAAARIEDAEARTVVQEDLMMRLDRLCDAWTAAPGAGLVWPGAGLFRLDGAAVVPLEAGPAPSARRPRR